MKLQNSQQTPQFANFAPHGLPRMWTHFKVNVRHFAKEYSLPLIITTIFLILIVVALMIRVSQRSALADLLAGVTSPGQDYGTLLSKDKASDLKKNENTNLPDAVAPAGSPSSLTINPRGTTSTASGSSTGSSTGGTSGSSTTGGGGASTGGGSTPAPVFGVSIASFQQDSATLDCATPKPKVQTCSKVYVFSSGVRTQNGPGTVNYSWRSNLASAIENGGFAAGSGSGQTTLQKTITIACTDPSSFSLQLEITSPSLTQSATINVNHNCVGI